MDLRQLFGSQVRFHRQKLGWTQAELADRIDLSQDMVGRIERGSAGPSFDTIERLVEVFAVDPALLFGAAPITNGPTSERERALSRVLRLLSNRSEADVLRAEKVLSAALSA